jgi:catechol 2,3-dioxygenase-like lactoylglutathione lyase family enzyme
MFRKIDCVRFRVPDLDQGIEYYCGRLGHELVWRRGSVEAGVRLPEADSELVLYTEPAGSTSRAVEVDLLVNSVDEAVPQLRDLGTQILVEPFDIPVGRCAVVQDPYGNSFVILDLSKGILKTDADRNVIP